MYRLQNFMQLGSQHSMRMYELIKMREGLRHLCLSVEELREILCCEHTYGRFSDFRRHVLERARTEIKDTCDAYYTYMVERDGRTPVRVRFLIHRREENETPPPVRREEDRPSESSGPDGQEVSTTGSGPRATNGASTASSASRLWQKIEERYNLYASVLSRLNQDTLNDISQSTVASALKAGKEAAKPLAANTAPTAVAEQVARRAVEVLKN